LFAGVGDSDDIIPTDFIVGDTLGNLQECIVITGKLLLELYFWLKCRSLSLPQIHRLPDMVEVALYQLQRLYAYKCWFRSQYAVNDRGIKAHGLLHMVHEIVRTGSLENTNTRIYENKHITDTKDQYKAGSKRTMRMECELFERNERKRVLDVVIDRYHEVHGAFMVPTLNSVEKESFNVYKTKEPNVVTYKCSSLKSDSVKVLFDVQSQCLLYADDITNVNPIMNVNFMWHDLNQVPSAQSFLRHYKNNEEGKLSSCTQCFQYMLTTASCMLHLKLPCFLHYITCLRHYILCCVNEIICL